MTDNFWPYDPTPFDDMFRRYGAEFGVDPHLLRAIASTESAFNPRAVSPVGARGLMQFMEDTGRDYGLSRDDLFDPDKSTRAAAQHIARMRKAYPHWTEEQLIAAYNAGEGNVEKYGGVPPFKETQDYVPKVLSQIQREAAPSVTPLGQVAKKEEELPIGVKQVGQVASAKPDALGDLAKMLQEERTSEPVMEDHVKKLHALLTGEKTQPTQELGDYTQYPKGSPEYFEAVERAGGLPAIRPTQYQKGETLPGATQPFSGYDTEQAYSFDYSARVVEVRDNDTVLVETPTGEQRWVRFPDVQAAEKQTELGAYQKAYMQAMVKPGDKVVVNQPKAGAMGKHGRDLGRVYWQDDRGRWVDLSKPWELKEGKESKEGEGDPGFFKGLWHTASLEIPEFLTFPQEIWSIVDSLIGDDEVYDPMQEEAFGHQFYEWAEKWEMEKRDKMERFFAYGYHPDGPVVDVPGIDFGEHVPDMFDWKAPGKMRIGEMARFGLGGTAYGLGVSFGLGKLIKFGMASADALRLGNKAALSLTAARAKEEANMARKLRKHLIDRMGKTDETFKKIDSIIEQKIEYHNLLDKHSHELVEASPHISAVERLRLYKELFVASWSDKYHPLIQTAKAARGAEGASEFENWIHQIKAAADVSESPIHQGPRVWEKMADGTQVSRRATDADGRPIGSLEDIWRGRDAEELREAGGYMAYDRVVNDLYPEWKAAVKAAGGDATKALVKAKKTGQRLVEVPETTYQEAVEGMRRYERIYGADGTGDLEEMLYRMKLTREWSVHAILNPLLEVNAISKKSYDQILAKNQHYAPFMRLSLDVIEENMGTDALLEILRLEAEMGEGGAKVASFIRGSGERAVEKVPMGRLTKALGEEAGIIVDPFQAFYTRGIAINKYVNQQRVRNMLGDMVDEILAEPNTPMGKWFAKTMRRTEDPKEIERILNMTDSNGFVRMERVSDDKVIRVGYQTHDVSLARAINDMSPGGMQGFKAMMRSPIMRALAKPTQMFRAGTVLGLHFMVRNPFRDQFQAATLTKYGYVPVLDWWRGLFGVLTKHPVYEAMGGSGATQATFINSALEAVEGGIREITTGGTISQQARSKILRSADDDVMTAMESFRRTGKIDKWRKAPGSTGRHFMERTLGGKRTRTPSTMVNTTADGVRLAFGWTRRLSEVFEEATRTGAAMRAVSRAKKGKRYTMLRAIDEAVGGGSGWLRLLTLRPKKGIKARFKKARYVSAEQKALTRKYGDVLDQDMIDEIRNITLDFQRRGRMGETLNAFYPFLNAELQDYARFGKALREAPLTTMMRAFTYITIPAIANWYMNFDNPLYQELPEVEKELFIHPWGYDERYKKFGRIPRPVGTLSGLWSLLPHKYLDYLAANDPAAIAALEEMLWPGMGAREARSDFQESIFRRTDPLPDVVKRAAFFASMGNLPWQGVPDPSGVPRSEATGDPLAVGQDPLSYGISQFKDYLATNTAARYVMPESGNLQDVALSAAPQFAAPWVQIGYNEDPFFRSPVEPWGIANKGLLPEDRFTEHTTPIEKWLARIMPGDVSPIQAGHIFRRTTGSLGAALLHLANATGEKAGIFEKGPGVPQDASDNYFAKAMYSKEPFGSNSRSVRELYSIWNEKEEVLASLEHNAKLGTMHGVDRTFEIMQEHPEFWALDVIKGAVDELADIHRERRAIKTAMDLDDDTRASLLFELDQVMTMIAYNTLQIYYKLERDPTLVGRIAGFD